ncbi:MAG: dihydropteroate synthase [Clostridiales bacterium]|jgi:dihydropteroate synthase|nr:dihydropteroate synthase [Clostridiales bacterium]
MKIANRKFELGTQTFIFGILNVTPDSFFDGGKFFDVDCAVRHAVEMIKDGADILDIGGQSTRPDYLQISAEQELDRVLPVLKALKNYTDVPISIDTYFAKVADVALSNGASIVNDIWGLQYDSKMASTIAKHNAACCIMHNKKCNRYENLIPDILLQLQECVTMALSNGVDKERIIVDPGIGFAKDTEQSLKVLQTLEIFKTLELPTLLGISNKSVFHYFGLDKSERLEVTLASSVYAASCGIDFVRVHDVKATKRALMFADSMYRKIKK